MRLVAYRLPHLPPMAVVPAAPRAHRCLPMSIAAAGGWWLLNPSTVTARWNGGTDRGDLVVETDIYTNSAASAVGAGILSWQIPLVVVTEPGWSLLVRGPANRPKDGASPLEGMVETDSAVTGLSANWQLTRPGAVTFAAGEAIAMLVPVRPADLAAVEPEMRDFADAPDIADEFADFKVRLQAGERGHYRRHAETKRLRLREFA